MKKFVAGSSIFFVIITCFFFYQGVFYPVKLKGQTVGDYWLVYRENIGPYEKVGTVIERICGDLKKDGIETKLTFGIYYDDPKKVKK